MNEEETKIDDYENSTKVKRYNPFAIIESDDSELVKAIMEERKDQKERYKINF